MAKPMVVTLPFVLLLLDYWPLRRLRVGLEETPAPVVISSPPAKPWRALVSEKLPFFALSFLSCLVTVWVQQRGGAMKFMEGSPLSFRLSNAVNAYGTYLRKMVWPSDLAVFYPLSNHLPIARIVGAALLLVVISVFAVLLRKKQPAIFVGWLWFLGTLIPVIGLVQVGAQALADRYTYLPLVGIFIMLAWGLEGQGVASIYARSMKLTWTGFALVACLILTSRQLEHWQNGITLFRQAARVTESNYTTHGAYGVALSAGGYPNEAIQEFSKALRLKPNYALAHAGIASELAEQGKLPEAIEHLKANLASTQDAGDHNNLGILLARQGQIEEAISHFEEAIRLKPEHLKAHLNLAMAWGKLGQTAKAIACYQNALRLQPQSPEPFDRLAWILATSEDAKFRDGLAALRLARQAADLTHRARAGCLDTLAAAYAETGSFKDAVATGTQALQIASRSGETALTTQIRLRLQSYREGKPYREELEEP
jgi:tetratricopeptide (TPR) repeat protein